MMFATILYWLSVVLIIHPYVIFPIILFLRSKIWQIPVHAKEITPSVSLIIAAYNEAESIGAKLENTLKLDYPPTELEVIIASDGSDDGTNQIVEPYTNERIKLLALPRQGKAGALNSAVLVAKGDILVFSDADSMYDPNAIRSLVYPFADETIGGVAGNQCYLKTKKNNDNSGEVSYWDFDRRLKYYESLSGNTISATGAIYAIRRTLFQPVPEGVTDDFVTSTRVITQGYRLIFEENARAYEAAAQSQSKEFGRKVRVMTRGLRSILEMRELLNPLRYGFYTFQLLTHKLIRRLVYIPMIILLIVNPFLLEQGIIYQLSMLAQLAFYIMALIAWIADLLNIPLPRLLRLPLYVCMVYFAALLATWNLLRGHRIKQWTTTSNSE